MHFLGRLIGGSYTEWLGDSRLELRFEHPRLGTTFELQAQSPSSVGELEPLRNTLRQWVAEPAEQGADAEPPLDLFGPAFQRHRARPPRRGYRDKLLTLSSQV